MEKESPKEKKELEKLTAPATQFLKLLRMFNDKPMQLSYFAYMTGNTRRWIRMLLSELRSKGYVKVLPENMRIHKSGHCKFIILVDEPTPEGNYLMPSDEIVGRIKDSGD